MVIFALVIYLYFYVLRLNIFSQIEVRSVFYNYQIATRVKLLLKKNI